MVQVLITVRLGFLFGGFLARPTGRRPWCADSEHIWEFMYLICPGNTQGSSRRSLKTSLLHKYLITYLVFVLHGEFVQFIREQHLHSELPQGRCGSGGSAVIVPGLYVSQCPWWLTRVVKHLHWASSDAILSLWVGLVFLQKWFYDHLWLQLICRQLACLIVKSVHHKSLHLRSWNQTMLDVLNWKRHKIVCKSANRCSSSVIFFSDLQHQNVSLDAY